MARFFSIFLCIFCAFASEASAQINIDDCDGDPTQCSVISSSTSSTTTAVAGGIVLTVVLGNTDTVTLKHYLETNAVAIRRDVNFGGGETVNDLAAFFRVDHKKFGRWLRNRRAEIEPIVKDADADALITITSGVFQGV